ncbi:MAG: hypothetical protein ABIG52_00990 [Nanoarchaeota archaeon]
MEMKKSGDMTIGTLGMYVLLGLTVLVLVYIFVIQPEGGFNKVADVEKLKKYLPNESLIGADKIEATPTVLPAEHLLAIKSLKNAINATLQSSKKDCFTDYGQLPDLGHRGTSIEFRYENGKTIMSVYGGVDGRKLIPELTTEFNEMVPCVIAGSNDVTKGFFKKFINKEEGVTSGYFSPTNYVRLFYWEGEGYTAGVGGCRNGNRIMTMPPSEENWFYDQGPNKYCDNLEDGGRFFSPDNKHICFMPTNWADNADEHGIDNDYISSTENKGIPNRISRGELTQC